MLEMEDSSEFVCCEEELHDPTLTHSPNSESLGGYVKNKLYLYPYIALTWFITSGIPTTSLFQESSDKE